MSRINYVWVTNLDDFAKQAALGDDMAMKLTDNFHLYYTRNGKIETQTDINTWYIDYGMLLAIVEVNQHAIPFETLREREMFIEDAGDDPEGFADYLPRFITESCGKLIEKIEKPLAEAEEKLDRHTTSYRNLMDWIQSKRDREWAEYEKEKTEGTYTGYFPFSSLEELVMSCPHKIEWESRCGSSFLDAEDLDIWCAAIAEMENRRDVLKKTFQDLSDVVAKYKEAQTKK